MTAGSRSNRTELRTTEVTDVDAFARLAAEWDTLMRQSASRVFFQRHHWNLLWWKHYAPPHSGLHIITCRDRSDRLVGVLPTYLRQHTWLGVPSVRELVFLGMGIALKTSESLDVLAARGLEADVAGALSRHLTDSDAWDRICLHQVRADSPLLACWSAAEFGRPLASASSDRAPFVDTSGSWDAFKHTLGRSMRRNVEYYPRRLHKQHAVDFRQATGMAEIDAAMSHLVRLHQARWTSRREAGAFRDPTFEAFLRAVARAGADDESTRLWTLAVDGTIQAALLGFVESGVLHYFQKGFNPEFAPQELGNVMLALCIRACCSDPRIQAFDFMGGGAPYKDLWARRSHTLVTAEVQRANSRTALFRARRQVRDGMVRLLRAVTPMTVREARRDYLKRRHLKEPS